MFAIMILIESMVILSDFVQMSIPPPRYPLPFFYC